MIDSEMNACTSLWENYRDGLSYQASVGLSERLPTYVRFYQGEQWAPPTKNTKNLPRPVVNIIKMICRSKKSAILATPVKIVYRSEKPNVNVDAFNKFAEYIQKEMDMDALDRRGIDDAVKKGSYFYHFFWDAEARGKDGGVEGGLRCEIIDALNIFFSNPVECDEQKQEWILISTRESVSSVREKCDAGLSRDAIRGDEENTKYGEIEQDGSELCTVLTKYFRKDGEVYCEIATRSAQVRRPFSITPNLTAARSALGIEDNEAAENGGRATLYPIVAGVYEAKERCIYGLGEVEGLIPNQKAINFNIAMALLNNQENAWGKYVVLPGALKGQTITNEPGQVLTDYTNTGGGIRKLTEQTVHSQPIQLAETLAQLTRAVTGATEVMTGETLGRGMSGAAIAQLQAQAQQPVEELKASFRHMKEKQGKVLAQFFKLYYVDKEFSYTAELNVDDNGTPVLDSALVPQIKTHKEEVRLTDRFNGKDYGNTEFTVIVESVAGTKASAAGDINALDVLLERGAISIESYVRAYPDDALSNKSELLKCIELERGSAISQLNERLRAVEEENRMLRAKTEEQNKTVENVVSLIKENSELRSIIAAIYSEARQKLTAANAEIENGNAKIRETERDAEDFAEYIYSDKMARAERSTAT